jgi:ATP-dependent DNA helicase RecQ
MTCGGFSAMREHEKEPGAPHAETKGDARPDGVLPQVEEPPAQRDPVDALASERFGVQALFPYQRLVVSNILEAAGGELHDGHERQLVILPTGAGKSLCFQLPAELLPGITVVVYPLRSLVADQARRLQERGIPVTVILGGQERREREQQWSRLEQEDAGKSRILLSNPECLLSPAVLERLRSKSISHMVIDEAHCVVEWGETFRPSYTRLPEVMEALEPAVVTAFTATASEYVLSRLREALFPGAATHLIAGNVDRPNIAYTVRPCLSKSAALLTLLAPWPEPASYSQPPSARPALVFCATRGRCEQLSRFLRLRLGDRRIRFYHAGLSPEEKAEVEQWFFHATDAVLVATCAYGMGVDKSGIRTVIHHDLPPSVEAYLQESGRAGRDGRAAQAVLLSSPEDHGTDFRSAADPLRQARRERLLGYLSAPGCRREYLLGLLGCELEACFGCDRCSGRALDEPPEQPVIIAFIRRHARRFRADQAAHILAGEHSPEIRERGWDLLPEFGALGKPKTPDDLPARGHSRASAADAHGPDTTAARTRLRVWSTDEVAEAVGVLIRTGYLRRGRRWLFPRRLSVRRSRGAGSSS